MYLCHSAPAVYTPRQAKPCRVGAPCLSLPHPHLNPRKKVLSWGWSERWAPLQQPHPACLLTASKTPSTGPTSLRRYFLRKTHHLRLDQSADYAEAAATPAHNPPQASTSLTLPFLSSPSPIFSHALSVSLYLSPVLFSDNFFLHPFHANCQREKKTHYTLQ